MSARSDWFENPTVVELILKSVPGTTALMLSQALPSTYRGVSVRPVELNGEVLQESAAITLQGVSAVASSNDYKDRGWLMLQVPGGRRLHSVQAKFGWKDQGWGNRKGEVAVYATDATEGQQEKLRLFKVAPHEGEAVEAEELGVAPHEREAVEVEARWPDLAQGGRVEVRYLVGGGGGHGLYISGFLARGVVWQD